MKKDHCDADKTAGQRPVAGLLTRIGARSAMRGCESGSAASWNRWSDSPLFATRSRPSSIYSQFQTRNCLGSDIKHYFSQPSALSPQHAHLSQRFYPLPPFDTNRQPWRPRTPGSFFGSKCSGTTTTSTRAVFNGCRSSVSIPGSSAANAHTPQ